MSKHLITVWQEWIDDNCGGLTLKVRCQEVVDLRELGKSTLTYKGKCVTLYGHIVQFDDNTGRCAFRADLSDSKAWRFGAFSWDHSSYFKARGRATSDFGSACSDLEAIYEGDLVMVYATGSGTITFNTMLGVNTEPIWQIEYIERYGSL